VNSVTCVDKHVCYANRDTDDNTAMLENKRGGRIGCPTVN